MTGNAIYKYLVTLGVPATDARKLVATGYAESSMRADAVGDGGDSIGLFQINIPAHPDKLTRLSGSSSRSDWVTWLKNPINNIKAAAAVYKSQGLGAWTEYKKGDYLQYLDLADSTQELKSLSGNYKGTKLTGKTTANDSQGGGNLKGYIFFGACLVLGLFIILGGSK